MSLLAHPSGKTQSEFTKLLGLPFSSFALFRLFLQESCALLLDLLDVAGGCFDCELSWKQIVSGVTRSYSDYLPARAQTVNVFTQEDVCVCHNFCSSPKLSCGVR